MPDRRNAPAPAAGAPERRFISSARLRAAAAEGEARRVQGYAALFNSPSQDLGGFTEVIHPGAFAEALAASDPRCLWNHDPNYVLGRVRSGTLRVREDETGLAFECDPPATTWAADLLTSIGRGDVDQCSFAFTIAEDGEDWNRLPDGSWRRDIFRVDALYDVSPVTYPAYLDTSLALRSLEAAQRRAAGGMVDTSRLRGALHRQRLAELL